MEVEIQKLLDSLADMREKANVNACFGEPVTAEDRTIIPVARVAYGFGLGVGHGTALKEKVPEEEPSKEAGGGGGGGGMRACPLAVVEVTPEGTWVKPVIDEQRVTLAGVLLAGWAVSCLAWALVRIFGRQE